MLFQHVINIGKLFIEIFYNFIISLQNTVINTTHVNSDDKFPSEILDFIKLKSCKSKFIYSDYSKHFPVAKVNIDFKF